MKTFKDTMKWASAEQYEFMECIKPTPMLSLHFTLREIPRIVHLKMEGANPTGSMKDRTGLALIQSLEIQRKLNTESVIVESTSGNLGVALASQCKVRGNLFIAVVDPKTTKENIAKMEAFGASIEMVKQSDKTGGYLLSRLARVEELCTEHKNYIWTNQYASPANPWIHFTSTGPEIYQQMHETVAAIFVPASTGGTLAGIGRFFREKSSATRIIGVDAYGSLVFGAAAAPRRLTGIGSSRRSAFLSKELYDSYILVKDEDAFAFCRALYTATDLMVGGSSGATLWACVQYLLDHPDLTDIVCICADRGENYLTTIFDDGWIESNGIHLPSIDFELIEKIHLYS